ncbi:SPOR domain-containing protein [Aestuariivirga litoralis]|uniref:SPOR domain-containing protein n=1 Tax=Aestuariivirga litoralis TaxID=2650924 RepID=UPI0018C81FC3|nr:SPOR domain-containing protein [Aestuariivirga litoralis]MBG1231620.1 hypothetical protein [Aestuariivirga litoralis]
MDQQSGDTADKRNWRERLGIGKNANGSDLPKLSDEFKGKDVKPAPAVPAARAAVQTPIKAAPMAPRAPRAPAPLAPRTAVHAQAPRQAPVAPDALASKLRDQREAAERLAQQRIQAAKARAEAASHGANAAAAATPPGAKPKFSFADQDGNPQNPGAARPTAWPVPASGPRPAAPPPPRPQFQPQVQPPRPQIGGVAPPPPSYQPTPGYGQSSYGQPQQPPYNPGYANPYGQQPPPPYRPIDPSTGYAPQPGYNPQGRGLSPAPGSARLQPVSRGPAAGYPPAQPQLQIGPSDDGGDTDDIFETAPSRSQGRRATANDYQQAYQDDLDYVEDTPRSGSFGMILGLLLLGLLVAFAVVFGYSHFIKGQTASTGGNVPVVSAPAAPAKSTPDTSANPQSESANKKLIYDRIEGDHEVPGGPLKSTEQPPAPQQNGDAQQGGGATNGDASQPVPLPPPPGGNNGQQGSLSPDANSNVASATSAAGQNPAANSSTEGKTAAASDANVTPTSAAPDASAAKPVAATQDAIIPAPPAPGETPAPAIKTATAAEAPTAGEQIGNTPAAPAKSKAVAKAETAKAQPTEKIEKQKSLGSSPVVLVPPSKTAAPLAAPAPVVIAQSKPLTNTSSGAGLYGDTPVAAAPQQVAIAAPKAPVPSAVAPAAPKPAATGAYVVQLASFGSRDEATKEYQRLSSKHGAVITRYAPIITQTTVAGAPRYNLNLGPMASNDVASSVCSSLISAGERDCAVRRQ